jgi:hypothetical protein
MFQAAIDSDSLKQRSKLRLKDLIKKKHDFLFLVQLHNVLTAVKSKIKLSRYCHTGVEGTGGIAPIHY